jgi:hypothetical protein
MKTSKTRLPLFVATMLVVLMSFSGCGNTKRDEGDTFAPNEQFKGFVTGDLLMYDLSDKSLIIYSITAPSLSDTIVNPTESDWETAITKSYSSTGATISKERMRNIIALLTSAVTQGRAWAPLKEYQEMELARQFNEIPR